MNRTQQLLGSSKLPLLHSSMHVVDKALELCKYLYKALNTSLWCLLTPRCPPAPEVCRSRDRHTLSSPGTRGMELIALPCQLYLIQIQLTRM